MVWLLTLNVLHLDDQVKDAASLQDIDALTSAIKTELLKEIQELETTAAFTESEKSECFDDLSNNHFES